MPEPVKTRTADTRTVFDPFELKTVEISNRLVDRLRGKYASGPHLPNGKPEFGWRQFEAPPIQHEAAAEIERLQASHEAMKEALRAAEQFIVNGVEFGFIRLPDKDDPALETLPKIRAALKEAEEERS
jgi:hypothetical protein